MYLGHMGDGKARREAVGFENRPRVSQRCGRLTAEQPPKLTASLRFAKRPQSPSYEDLATLQ